jgi:CDP-diacylglycerol--serine O-phosphatidyltransferase
MKRYPGRRSYRPRSGQINTLKRGVYILPNLFTSLGLFCGFFAIIATMQGSYVTAAWTVVLAGVFDALDGRIARMTRTTSRFGVEYDSLSDLVAFGVAPAVMAFGWVLGQYGRWGWLAAFLFVACGAIRLARFNVQVNAIAGRYFLGLPIPAAAGLVAATVIFCFHLEITERHVVGLVMLLTMYALGLLMVSTIRFNSFKNLDLASRKPFSMVVAAILLICIVASEPQIMLFGVTLIYALSGPVGYCLYLIRKNRRRKDSSAALEENHDNHTADT